MKKLIYLMVVIAILGLIVSGCSIPLKSVVPTSEKGNPKPELGTPTIEKITFIHYAKPNDRSKPVWDDTEDDFKFIIGGIKWFNTISYKVNPSGSDLSETDVLNAIVASATTWDSETSFSLYSSLTTTSTDNVVSGDGNNTVGWGSLDPGIIAVTYLWFNPATKEIVEFDTVFNTYYTWSTTGAYDAMDLQNIATHEFGHNGLNDLRPPKDWALTMYGYSNFGDIDKQSLGTGDILGIKELYGL